MRILIIDDEDLFREDLATLLRQANYDCLTAASGEAGLEAAARFRPDVVLCDLVMPGIGGVEVTAKLREELPDCAVLVISAHATVYTAIGAFRRGALDVIVKPVQIEALLNTIRRIEHEQRLKADLIALRLELARCGAEEELLGSSPAMEEVRTLARQVAAHDTPVLVTGESGTGKEVVARMIHSASGRRGPFVAVNSGAVADSLFESELFGHAKGAFTGADRSRHGFFEAAQGGTLLLDEVGEIPVALQGKLLRAVECREITRVGDARATPIDVRIVAATNGDLDTMVEDGRFRKDLYYRLQVVNIAIPPLRERRDDIAELATYFLRKLARSMNVRRSGIADDALCALSEYPWPGNVRELRNAIERALIVGTGELVTIKHLPAEVQNAGASNAAVVSDNLKTAMRHAERMHIERVLRSVGGSRSAAARKLGIDPSTLWRKLEADQDRQT